MLALGAAGLGACALISACSPVQAGSAAIVGNQRITSSTLDQQVSNLQAASKPLGSQITLTAAEQPRAVLTWLIRFSIMDQVAADNGISVTQAQSQTGLSEIQSEAASSASQEGFSSATALFLGNGISPQMLPALGTWVAQETAYQTKANGGKQVTSQAESTAVTAKYNKAAVPGREVARHSGQPAVRAARLLDLHGGGGQEHAVAAGWGAVARVDHRARPRVLR